MTFDGGSKYLISKEMNGESTNLFQTGEYDEVEVSKGAEARTKDYITKRLNELECKIHDVVWEWNGGSMGVEKVVNDEREKKVGGGQAR